MPTSALLRAALILSSVFETRVANPCDEEKEYVAHGCCLRDDKTPASGTVGDWRRNDAPDTRRTERRSADASAMIRMLNHAYVKDVKEDGYITYKTYVVAYESG